MNEKFREYAFGRAFNISLSERHIQYLALLCKGDTIAAYGFDVSKNGLLRRGLIEQVWESNEVRFRPTKAGRLVYELLVEAGEYKALDDLRQKTLEAEEQLHRIEWESRFGEVQIKLKDAYRKDKVPA